MKTGTVKTIGLALSLIFAPVGAIFLLAPESVLRGMNLLGRFMGLGGSHLHGAGFFPVMAGAYMAVVTILAWRIFRNPSVSLHPLLLAQAKAASSLLSFAIFVFHGQEFILLANGVVDGALALLSFLIFRSMKKHECPARTS